MKVKTAMLTSKTSGKPQARKQGRGHALSSPFSRGGQQAKTYSATEITGPVRLALVALEQVPFQEPHQLLAE